MSEDALQLAKEEVQKSGQLEPNLFVQQQRLLARGEIGSDFTLLVARKK